jgi:hypothetical protein
MYVWGKESNESEREATVAVIEVRQHAQSNKSLCVYVYILLFVRRNVEF